MSTSLFTFKPISYTPITADHPWVMRVGRNEPEITEPPQATRQRRKEKTMKINNEVLIDQNVTNRSCERYSHVKSRISPEETAKYLERKKVRERQKIEDELKRETEEMQECTFHPVITRTFRKPY
jgi:hypothetical protein